MDVKKRIYDLLKVMTDDISMYHRIGPTRDRLLHMTKCRTTGCRTELDIILDEYGITIETQRMLKMTTVTAKEWKICTQPSAFGSLRYMPHLLEYRYTAL